jgi:hypothetical protein
MAQAFVLIVAALVLAPEAARAQFPGYGWGYGFPGYGYAGYPGPYGFGMPGFGYGMGYGYGMPGFGYGMGYGYGMPGYGYGMGYGFGMPGYGLGVGYGNGVPGLEIYYGSPGFGVVGSGSPIVNSPYLNPLFGVGMTPLGLQSYLTESNMLGRGQIGAAVRARAREQQGYYRGR